MIMVLMSLVPGLYSIASSIWYAALATIFSGISSGGLELSRVTYITKIANHEQVQTYWGVDYTLMGARGIIAPFVGIGMMHLLGLQAVFFLSFVAILTCFLAMRYFTISEPSALQMKVDEAV